MIRNACASRSLPPPARPSLRNASIVSLITSIGYLLLVRPRGARPLTPPRESCCVNKRSASACLIQGFPSGGGGEKGRQGREGKGNQHRWGLKRRIGRVFSFYSPPPLERISRANMNDDERATPRAVLVATATTTMTPTIPTPPLQQQQQQQINNSSKCDGCGDAVGYRVPSPVSPPPSLPLPPPAAAAPPPRPARVPTP